jgi:hypothetical protein
MGVAVSATCVAVGRTVVGVEVGAGRGVDVFVGRGVGVRTELAVGMGGGD